MLWQSYAQNTNLHLFVSRGGARNFPTGGLNLPTRGLIYGF